MGDNPAETALATGEKRKTSDSDSEKPVEKKPRQRRFDMKTRPVKLSATDKEAKTGSDASKENDVTLTVSRLLDAEITSIQSRTLATNFVTYASSGGKVSLESNWTESSYENDTEIDHTPTGKKFQSNIVDDLFKDFISTKMKEADDEDNSSKGHAFKASNKDSKNSSIDEINRLLDAEITSIQSRGVVSSLYDDSDSGGGDDNDNDDSPLNGANSVNTYSAGYFPKQTETASAAPQLGVAGDASNTTDLASNGFGKFSSTASTAGDNTAKTTGLGVTAEKPTFMIGKKAPVKKLGLSIRQESLALIIGAAINAKQLEDGEVASSSDSEQDKKRKKDDRDEIPDDSPETEDDDVSETGSISDTDEEKTDGKDSKSKKKKKHKHKHKKNKKHKTNKEKKDKDSKEESSKDDDSKKESKKSKKKHKHRSRSGSRSRRKSDSVSRSESKHMSKSPSKDSKSREPFDPWDARSYRPEDAEGGKRKSCSPDRSRSPHRSHHKSRDSGRSRERSRERRRERSRDKSRDRSAERSRGRSDESSRDKHRGRSRSREHRRSKDDEGTKDLRVRIDKNKLRKIAIANALAKMEAGQGPSVDLTALKSGGKSVAELTEFCKRISEKERNRLLFDSSESSSEEELTKSDGEDMPIHHPFKVRDAAAIVMNIRNAKQLPILTPQEKQTQAATLRVQFPVSSGAQHRQKESEWVPVIPTTATTATTATAAKASIPAAPAASTVMAAAAIPLPVAAGVGTVVGMGAVGVAFPDVAVPMPALAALAPPPAPPPAPAPTPVPQDSVFPTVDPTMDIGSIISERLQAVRKLQQNPYDVQALTSMHKAQEQAKMWAQSKQIPGQFMGTTGVQCLTPEELAGPDKRYQAWARKDQLKSAKPIDGGIGMFLLQKMGWKQGEGLGKNCEGSKEPLMLDVKMDRKGLTTTQEHKMPHFPQMNRGAAAPPRAKDLSGKHPVSALTELCTKRKWGMPNFELVNETGPAHKKTFLFKVSVNGVEYCSSAPVGNKKLAKAQAAAVCLQAMGLIPPDTVITQG